MADFLDVKRNELDARLRELRPVVEEYARLEAAVAALDGVGTPPAPGRTTQSAPGRASKRGRPGTTGPRGDRRSGGTRRDEALGLVTANPGITVAAIAEQMGIKQNYLYRVLPALAADGLIVRDGRGWRPAPPA